MKLILAIFSLILLTNCGKIKVETNPVEANAKFGPDFAQAAEFCDQRYGQYTIEAEACFNDYRSYLKPTVSIDLASISNFCNGAYTTIEEKRQCERDLLDLLSQTVNPQP